jgi:hippurate hydrolase
MRGTCRTFKPAVRDLVMASIHRISHGIAGTYGLTAEVTITTGMDATVNDPAEADSAAEAAAAAGITVRRDLPPSMASEDFGWYLAERPGAFAWIGNGPADGGRELHNPHYDYNDAILPAAARWLATVAKTSLA